MDPRFQAIVFKHWLRRIAPPRITHFLTVSFSPPRHDVDPEKWNQIMSAQLQNISELIVRRFDKRLYGRSHLRIPEEQKFPFLMLMETHDKNKRPTFAHVHGALSFPEPELSKLPARWPQIERDIEKLVRESGLEPNIRLDSSDNNVVDYVGKNAQFQADRINTRATMNKAVTDFVSS
jgi:hypothetical protein